MQLIKLCATQHNQKKILVLSLSRILCLAAQAHPLPTVGRVQRQPAGRGMGADSDRGRWWCRPASTVVGGRRQVDNHVRPCVGGSQSTNFKFFIECKCKWMVWYFCKICGFVRKIPDKILFNRFEYFWFYPNTYAPYFIKRNISRS